MKFSFLKYFFLFPLCILFIMIGKAQQVFEKGNPVTFVKQRATHFDEKVLRERMLADGLPIAVTNKLVEQHRQMWAKGMLVEWSSAQTARNGPGNPGTCAVCSDMSAENGWGAWDGAVGDNSSGNPPLWGPLGSPTAPNFNLNSGPGKDICTPGFNPGDPPLPLVAPGFGSTSIELGEPQMAGSVTEQLVYPLTVAVTDTNFIYAYALVLEDAGHPNGERPYAEFVMLNPAGDTIPCAFFHYEAAEPNGQLLPGFYQGTCGAKYKPWTTVGVNLSSYVGQTVTLIITNADCIWGAHFAQSYWDFNCGILQGSSSTDCYGVADTLRGPDDPNINYTYHWFPGGQTTQNIIVYPQPGDTFIVAVEPPTGCNFYEIFVPQPQGINPNFTYTPLCGSVNFHDVSTTSSGAPIIAWHWSFPGGNPSSSTLQNPVVSYAGGNFTATLIVTAASGCIDTVTISGIPTSASPTASFTANNVCIGESILFNDHSTPVGNDPIVLWNWNFGDGQHSVLADPNHLYASANSFVVSLTVTSQGGCSSTITDTVVVHPFPVANFTADDVCEHTPTVFDNLSAGSPSQWLWNFGDGNGSSVESPTHTYTVSGNYITTLVVVSGFGCRDTTTRNILVNPNPVAQFSAVEVCVGDTTCFTDLSTVSSGVNVLWSWNFGDTLSGAANISTQQNPCHIFTPDATYAPVVFRVTTDMGCVNSISHNIDFFTLPVAAFSATKACVSDPTCFTDLSTINTGQIVGWIWNFGDAASGATNFSDAENPCHTFTPNGNFIPVRLTITSVNGCEDSYQEEVDFWEFPQANFTNTVGCLNTLTHFTDLSNPSVADDPLHIWNWNFGDNTGISWNQNPDHLYSSSGYFDVQLIVTTAHNCHDTITIPARVYSLPVPEFSDSAQGCTPFCATFNDLSSTVDGNISNWQWTFAGGRPTISTSANPDICYEIPGRYNVTLITTTSFGCKDTLMKPRYVDVFELPTADFSINPDTSTSLLIPSFDFRELWSANVAEWQWDFGDGSEIETGISNPSHSYGASIDNNTYYSYLVTVYVQTENGCRDSITRKVEVTPDFSFFIPNTFTPNGDHINDMFYGKGRGIRDYTISIYDRWGILIWTCHEDGLNTDWDRYQQDGMPGACQWNGIPNTNISDRKLQNDVYVWRVRLTTIFGEEKVFIGHVSAVK